jgi:hypothetical protein
VSAEPNRGGPGPNGGPKPDGGKNGRVLDPPERLSEILFGLIMALTFTGSIHAASAGEEEIRTMLFGAVGCNIAWGIVDAVMYVLGDLVDRNRSFLVVRALHGAKDPQAARAIVAEALPPALAAVMRPAELDTVRAWAERLPALPSRARVTARSLRGALGVFLLVSLSTFPMVVPFLALDDPVLALRISHAIALVLLFAVGAAFGRYSGERPLLTGLGMVAIGIPLVLLTIALGG